MSIVLFCFVLFCLFVFVCLFWLRQIEEKEKQKLSLRVEKEVQRSISVQARSQARKVNREADPGRNPFDFHEALDCKCLSFFRLFCCLFVHAHCDDSKTPLDGVTSLIFARGDMYSRAAHDSACVTEHGATIAGKLDVSRCCLQALLVFIALFGRETQEHALACVLPRLSDAVRASLEVDDATLARQRAELVQQQAAMIDAVCQKQNTKNTFFFLTRINVNLNFNM